MDTLTIELPPPREQTAMNLKRWAELFADPEMRKYQGRIEKDRHGHVLMSPPPAKNHGGYQFEIGFLLRRSMARGRVFTECPISTADGVRAADVAWASAAVLQETGDNDVFIRVPEIGVEVLSPDNTAKEMREKTALDFDAGAQEVWHCSLGGRMTFFAAGGETPLPRSRLDPEFPVQVELR